MAQGLKDTGGEGEEQEKTEGAPSPSPAGVVTLEGRHPGGPAKPPRLPTLLAGNLVWPQAVAGGEGAQNLGTASLLHLCHSGHSAPVRGEISGTCGLHVVTAAKITRECHQVSHDHSLGGVIG